MAEFTVYQDLYDSTAVLSHLLEAKNLISNYLNLLSVLSNSYEQLIIYAEQEKKVA